MERMEQGTIEAQQSLPGVLGSSFAEVAHEARNMVTALGVYCDLLEQPGVFTDSYRHYGRELRTVATASSGLVSRLLGICATDAATGIGPTKIKPDEIYVPTSEGLPAGSKATQYWDEIPAEPIRNLAWELQTSRDLLAALAGPSVTLTIDAIGGALPVRLTGEAFTRILVNLVKNSVEAISGTGGRIQMVLRECQVGPNEEKSILLNVEDNGQGIPPDALNRVFDSGYTTRGEPMQRGELPQAPHRGLGLSITRSLIEAAGGSVRAANRDPLGACIQIALPTGTA